MKRLFTLFVLLSALPLVMSAQIYPTLNGYTYTDLSSGYQIASPPIGTYTYTYRPYSFNYGYTPPSTTLYNFSNGVTGAAYTFGGYSYTPSTTLYNFSNGVTGAAYTFGSTTLYNFSNGITGAGFTYP